MSAAAALFASHGFAGVGIDDIGASVGVTGPAIYRHFKGKAAVLEAVLTRALEDWLDDDTPASSLDEFATKLVASALDRPMEVATYIRERGRLGDRERRRIEQLERDVDARWNAPLVATHPDASRELLAARRAAAVVALSAVALERPAVPRPRLEALLVESVLAVLTAPLAVRITADEPVERPPRRETRRDRVLRTAVALFRERGYHGVGIDEIGEAAGLSGPSVYRYFDSKGDILAEAYHRGRVQAEIGLRDALATATSDREALQRLAVAYASVAAANLDLVIVTTHEDTGLPEFERARLRRRTSPTKLAWREVLRDVRPSLTDAEAGALVAGVFPLMNQCVARRLGPAAASELAVAFVLGTGVNDR